MNFSPDFNSAPLPTADTLMFWGFIIGSGILVAQISTKLSERFFQDEDEELEDVTEADEIGEAEQQADQESENEEDENEEETPQIESVGEDGLDKDA
ncbi:hypothetical protein H6F88_15205 [Oculatella sp. FACHB-28]|uniref:hypothetical protein n=1 Tax=Cyanophyceae TaxID=3028117 RepID=UPI001681D647|nr:MULTISPECIES: hypothetical protein [Cyanophyceae]MBD1868665.1 hypothetical protein [Cyanobacteria bacterium FACHB-471]MBD2057349.1 hypothetical protein [Oculatella sp. FACHB-28]MBD2067830.1 hypothetical protein [Leptolyngbya sp. FACHB-671]